MAPKPEPSPALIRFRASMVIDYNKWHDGEPYDIAALAEITALERDELSAELNARSTLDWRDVEALRAIGTPEALKRVGQAAEEQHDGGGAEALVYEIETKGWSTAAEKRLIDMLEHMATFESSIDRLFEICEAHPTEAVRAQVFRNARIAGDGAIRYSAGAFLLYLAGHDDNWAGWNETHRLHLLGLQSADYNAYKAAVAWLQEMIEHPKAGAKK